MPKLPLCPPLPAEPSYALWAALPTTRMRCGRGCPHPAPCLYIYTHHTHETSHLLACLSTPNFSRKFMGDTTNDRGRKSDEKTTEKRRLQSPVGVESLTPNLVCGVFGEGPEGPWGELTRGILDHPMRRSFWQVVGGFWEGCK